MWFNDDCKTAVKDRKKALHKVKASPTTENIEKYKIIRAKARRTIKCAKRRSLQSFVSKINSRTSIRKVWAMVRKLAGKYHFGDIPHLGVNNNKIRHPRYI